MPKLMDFVFDLSDRKKHLLHEDPDNIGDFKPYVVNMVLGGSPETIMAANEMNKAPGLPKDMQYDFLFHAIPKRFRRFSFVKGASVDDLALMQRYFECNAERAKDYLRLLRKEQIEEIREYYYEGGRQ